MEAFLKLVLRSQCPHSCVCLFFEPGLQPPGGWCTRGQGRPPGVHCAFRQQFAQTLLSMFISSLSPQRSSDCRAGGELFTAVDKERGGSLCSGLGTGLPERWGLALLAGILPTLPPRRFKVLKALGTRPGLVPVWNLGSMVEEDGLPHAVQFLQILMKSPHHLAQNPTVVPSGSLGPAQIRKGSPGW